MTDIYQKAYTSIYPSRLGDILLAADEIGLTGLWFFGQSYFADTLPTEQIAQETPILAQAREWLDEYFSGKEPDFTPTLHPIGSPFRQAVWKLLLQIPYGQTTTYGEIARQLEKLQNRPHMSAQAVGGAVGHNGISIIIPCHRVVGTKGSLTGYAGGLDKKMALLELEHANRKTYPENLSL
jgi:methylated-DNA-[protein]-cysteine S-methyltransferase